MKSVANKVAVVTGAASGIGRALAIDLATRGARLALSDVDTIGLAATVAAAREAGSPEVLSHQLDVADRAAFTSYADTVTSHFGTVNIVINNAGVALSGRINDLEWDDIDWIMGIDLWGVIHGTKLFLPALIASGDGHIVNLSSLFGLISVPDQGFYNAAKYAVRGLTEALREEMIADRHKVGVTSVHPGGIKTAVARNARYSAKVDGAKQAAFFDKHFGRMPAEKAASIIIKRGILGGQARVLVGLDAHLIHQGAKLLGSRYQDLLGYGSRRVGPL